MTDRFYATLVSFDKGVLQVIGPDGNMYYFRQRGTSNLTDKEYARAFSKGLLCHQAMRLRVFPSNWSLINEEPEILGKVTVTFNKKALK